MSSLLVLGLMAGCGGGGSSDVKPGANRAANAEFDASDLSATWPVVLADDAAREPYQSDRGWATLLMKRDYKRSTGQMGTDMGRARAHADAAGVFRQAAMLSANSLVQTYGETPKDTDPLGVAHLLTVSYAVLGDLDKAKASSGRMSALTDDPAYAWHQPWQSWLASGAAWPPDLSAMPLEVPAVTPGKWPQGGSVPHYALPEQGGGGRSVDMGDPGVLVRLALWHHDAALAAAGTETAAIQTYMAPYRMPVEGTFEGAVELPMQLQFGGDFLVPGDGPFMAAAVGGQGTKAIVEFRDSSMLARIAEASLGEDGKLDAESLNDNVALLRQQLVDQQAAITEGTIQGHHRVFADVSAMGVYRMLALVAEADGDRETSGLLRIAANEATEMASSCPTGKLAFSAWDASNRFPMRAQEIVHNQLKRYPSLETARYALDVMALRVSREQIRQGPQ